ncbi:hypothetical protein [Desulfobacula sp.]|uniref:hypothetical protein n=1 Tax=Desulfobacula sp. TaxID=2593537 RepID=UPI002612C65A|nr:hypothetical protein [Desulfobacula sp.]
MTLLFRIQFRAVFSALIVAGILFSGALMCSAAGRIAFSNDRLTLFAENEPLIPLLEEIAKATQVVIFIAQGFDPGNVSAHVNNLPLERALNRILKGFSVAMVYHEEQGITRVTAVKIYPKGNFSGPMNVVIESSVPETEAAVKRETRYEKDSTDILNPGEYVRTVEYDSLVPTALEFEQKETDAWEAIQVLKQQLNNEPDETKNNVLSMALLDKYQAFDALQKHHINLLENLHRVEHFNQSKATLDKQQQD